MMIILNTANVLPKYCRLSYLYIRPHELHFDRIPFSVCYTVIIIHPIVTAVRQGAPTVIQENFSSFAMIQNAIIIFVCLN